MPTGPALPAPGTGWEGLSSDSSTCYCTPPNTAGAAGTTQYVQAVNTAFQVWDKSTGTATTEPLTLATLWSGFGGICETSIESSPVVLYDQLADRWLLGHVPLVAPATLCLLVSTNGNAAGTYTRYEFPLATGLIYDSPRLALWSDGYYLSALAYDPAQPEAGQYQGPVVFAAQRETLLAGTTPGFVAFPTLGNTVGPLIPASLDGTRPPPSGAPAIFATLAGGLTLYHAHVTWASDATATPGATPGTSFDAPITLDVAGFTQLCPGTRDCLPQPDAPGDTLDGLGDRLSARLSYRNFGDHAALLVTHAVDVGVGQVQAGLRWYEIGDPTGSAPSLDQQSTYAPDGDSRWLSAGALDANGNVGIGYTLGGPNTYPSLRYTGRLATDPSNWLPAGEGTMQDGAGSQLGWGNFWGTTSAMSVDPADDCTFWFTSEYYPLTHPWLWNTRVASFRFPSCVANSTPVPTATATPAGPTATSTPPCNMGWTAAAAPTTPADTHLLGLAARTPGDAWAVGYAGTQSLVLHWNGTAWTTIASPNPGTSFTRLSSVTAITATDAWAAGYTGNGSLRQPLILHWDGSAWTAVAVPGVDNGSFAAITALRVC